MHQQKAEVLRRMMQSVSNLHEYTANLNPDDTTYQGVIREEFGKILGCTTSSSNLACDTTHDQDQSKIEELGIDDRGVSKPDQHSSPCFISLFCAFTFPSIFGPLLATYGAHLFHKILCLHLQFGPLLSDPFFHL